MMDFLTIEDLFSSSFFAIPDYQRDYSWKKSETSVLVDDILSIMDEHEEMTHFLGAIVTVPFDKDAAQNISISLDEYRIKPSKVKHVIDGQQRLTSFTVFLKVMDDLIKSKSDEISKDDIDAYHKTLSDLYLGPAKKKRSVDGKKKGYVYAPRLILNGNTGDYYNQEILGVTSKKGKGNLTGARRLRETYAYISKEVETNSVEWLKENPDATITDYYDLLCETVTEKITFVEIACDAATNAFQVFDSLNGKGLDLTVADRIKNLVMSWSPQGKGNEKWTKLVEAIGENDLTHFFVAYHFYNNEKRISKNKLPEEFKKLYSDKAKSDFNLFYSNLMEAGELFGSLKKAKTGMKKIDHLLKQYNTLQFDQPYNLLFATMWGLKEEIQLRPKKFEDLVATLFNLVIRMQVCEISMNKLDSMFIDCIKLIRKQGTTIEMVTKKLENYKTVVVPDEKFKIEFSHFCPTDSTIEYYYLSTLENYRRRKVSSNRDTLSRTDGDNQVTVEHIIPQEPKSWTAWYGSNEFPFKDEESFFLETVVENIGNKLLLYGDDNSSASDGTLKDKRLVYKEGKNGQSNGTPEETFQLVKDFLNNKDFEQTFLHTQVKNRAESLAEDAAVIWS